MIINNKLIRTLNKEILKKIGYKLIRSNATVKSRNQPYWSTICTLDANQDELNILVVGANDGKALIIPSPKTKSEPRFI